MIDIKELFTKTYKNNLWSGSDSKSGIGSSLDYTVHFRKNLIKIITDYKIETIFDCSCGDWYWMREIKEYLPNYVGNDIVESLIEENKKKYESENIKFVCNDMLESLKSYQDDSIDLIICRHTFEHLSTKYCIDSIKEIKRVSKYALITSNSGENSEINVDGTSARIINLEKDEYFKILGNPYKKLWDTIGEPIIGYENCYFYKLK